MLDKLEEKEIVLKELDVKELFVEKKKTKKSEEEI